jgi:hypothetical protein
LDRWERGMSEITIRTNGHYRPVLCWENLTEKEQEEYAYLEEEDGSFFRYKNWTYFLGDFMRLYDEDAPFTGWEGYHSDSYFSGVLVKYSNCGDAVKVATYYS